MHLHDVFTDSLFNLLLFLFLLFLYKNSRVDSKTTLPFINKYSLLIDPSATSRRKKTRLSMTPLTVFLFSLFILHTGVTSKSDDPLDANEKKALIHFKLKVRHKLSWNESEHACSWKGVTCSSDNTTVLYLRLPARSLVGEIPPGTIGMLTNLRVLSLRINKLNGNIPTDFSNLTSLTRLSLYNNSFSGQLPYIYFKQTLRSFNVSLNKLNSSIPISLSMFPISAFDVNVFFCGKPFNACNASYPPPDLGQPTNPKKKGEIVGILVGSALLLLLILCCVRRKIYKERKQPRNIRNSAAKDEDKRNKLVLFGVYSFDLEDILKASADVLGEGSGGISYKQVLEEEKTTVVVKRLKDVVVTQEEFRKTMEVLGKMKNQNVVPLIAYYYSKDEKWLVYDYMPAGTLSALLHGSTGSGRTQLDWENRMRIALSAAKGLAYLHLAEVVHGNIKSSNVLLRQETKNEASLSDYGLNTLFNHQVIGYWAPEVPEAQKVTSESDVYSFGVLLLELLTGQTPKQQASSGKERVVNFSKWVETIVCPEPKAEIFDVELRRGHNNNIDEMVQLLRIAKDCVSLEPNQRPKMQDVVSMMENVWLRPSSDDHSKGYDYTPSTETRDTPSSSTITP
ncbi:hypothetical protein L1987_31101 [Smallanthus sonchifolius]|uniref:Uncharacterized protein n=1 Tax=Smallanthus sonchifolius TaxID=185202 RepID=A0ACB9I4M2_9ASTR|nr:hypothetical protein L1987_31101 [Smallanthus sonchifolius]